MKKIGWIGLGNMGLPMAKNLEKAGFPLSVYNRNPAKAADFQNGKTTVCKSVTELTENSDIIFTMISNDAAVSAVYDEIYAIKNIEGKIFIDMSTISQDLSEATAAKLKAANAAFLDAPVAGSVKPAADGTLIIMVGGDEAVLETAKPYLEKLGKLVKRMGENGKGIATKLSVNYYLTIMYEAMAEGVLLAEKKGVQRADFMEIINASALGNGASNIKTPLLVNEKYDPQFALKLMLKDVLLAQKNGADFPLTKTVIDTYTKANEAGFGDSDVIAIVKYIKDNEHKG